MRRSTSGKNCSDCAIRCTDNPPCSHYHYATQLSNLAHALAISGNDPVDCQQNHSFDPRLRNEHAIKRVLVDRGQFVHPGGVFGADGQLRVAVYQKHSPKTTGVHTEIGAPQPMFDGDLPKARGAEEKATLLRLPPGGRYVPIADSSARPRPKKETTTPINLLRRWNRSKHWPRSRTLAELRFQTTPCPWQTPRHWPVRPR